MKKVLTSILFLVLLFKVNCQQTTISEQFHQFHKYNSYLLGQKNNHLYYYSRIYDRVENVHTVYYYETNQLIEQANPTIIKNSPQTQLDFRMSFLGLIQNGDELIEYYEVFKKGSRTGFGFQKRNLNSMNEVSDLVQINELGFRAIRHDEKGFYFLTNKKLFHLTYELDIEWVSTFDFLPNKNLNILQYDLDKNHNFIITGVVTKNSSAQTAIPSKQLNSSLLISITDFSGKTEFINPQIGKEVFYRFSKFHYDNANQELLGVILTSHMLSEKYDKSKGIGYSYHRWGLSGDIIDHQYHIVPFSSFVTNQFRKYAQRVGFNAESYEFPYVGIRNRCSIEFINSEQILIIINGLEDSNKLISNSKYFISLDGSGKISWTTILPYNSEEAFKPLQYIIKNGKIVCFTFDYSKFYIDNELGYHNDQKQQYLTIVASKHIINLQDGESTSRKLHISENEQAIPKSIDVFNSNQVVIKYHIMKPKSEQLQTILY